MVNVNEILDGHVALEIECLDRIYLNGYVPILQVPGQVVNFMREHLGKSIPSPAIMEKIGTVFRRDVAAFAEDNNIPVVRFKKDDRKIDVMRRHLSAQEKTGSRGSRESGSRRSTRTSSPPTAGRVPAVSRSTRSRRQTGG